MNPAKVRAYAARNNSTPRSMMKSAYRRNGVGISPNHALALVNYSGTTGELLSLASEIENAVSDKFGIKLKKEAVIV